MGKTKPKLLVICGPTATGKTQLVLQLAKKLDGILVSADSRQVYKYMDIGTGKDVKNILGYNLVNPNEESSVSQYSRFASQKIQEIQGKNKLPILVGGTGLYIKAVIDNIATINVAPDKNLREKLHNKTIDELYEILVKINSEKAKLMNESDRKNSRRLVRAIEIVNSNLKNVADKPEYDVLMIGLMADKKDLKERIEKRVEERIRMGFEKEVDFLKENGFWNGAPQKTLGYKDWPDIEKWKTEEFKYAKRQMTWFKKEKRINWFDIASKAYEKEVEKLAQRWYAQADAKES